MQIIAFLPDYFLWHYTHAFVDLTRIWFNYMWFVYHFFSIPTLLSTLFTPWRRLHEEKKRGFDIEDFAATIVVNFFMRLVGALTRITVIVFGLIFLALIFVLGIVVFVIWATLPFLIVGFFIWGVALLFGV